MLTDFFRINLPYGMERNNNGEWMFFNREYVPLGWSSHAQSYKAFVSQLPLYTKYTKPTDATLVKLAWESESGITRNEKGEITKVFFYNDRTNPQNDPKCWSQYLDKIKLLSKCAVKSSQFSF